MMTDTEFDALVMLVRETANAATKYRATPSTDQKRRAAIHNQYVQATKRARTVLVTK